jgi:hypothetical protein
VNEVDHLVTGGPRSIGFLEKKNSKVGECLRWSGVSAHIVTKQNIKRLTSTEKTTNAKANANNHMPPHREQPTHIVHELWHTLCVLDTHFLPQHHQVFHCHRIVHEAVQVIVELGLSDTLRKKLP